MYVGHHQSREGVPETVEGYLRIYHDGPFAGRKRVSRRECFVEVARVRAGPPSGFCRSQGSGVGAAPGADPTAGWRPRGLVASGSGASPVRQARG